MAWVRESVAAAFDEAWGRLHARLEGLTEDEWSWEPVGRCWSVRPGPDGRWAIDGGGGGPPPDPAPFTTIAWRIEHIRLSFITFGDRLFRDGTTTLDDIAVASSAAQAVAALGRDYDDWWRAPLAARPDGDWHTPIGPAFGPYADRNTLDLALHVLDELVHHGGEIGLLRDLYRHRA